MKQTLNTTIQWLGLFILALVPGTLLSAKCLAPSFPEGKIHQENFQQGIWPTSAIELQKKIALADPGMQFKKGKDANQLSSYFANEHGKSSILMYCKGDQVMSVQYMVVLDLKDPDLDHRLKAVRKFMLTIWGVKKADWIDAQINQVKKNTGHSVKNRMPDTDLKLEFEYLATHKVANLIFNQIIRH